jgi:hypothetical protein
MVVRRAYFDLANQSLPGEVKGQVFLAPADSAADLLSHWKNEGKNPSRHPLRGGFEAPDTLYDSHLKLTGFSLCLTLKIPNPESRRGLPIFVPYPSSTR